MELGSAGINQNTDTTGTPKGETIERSGSSSEGTVSFDELESVMDKKPAAKKRAEPKEKKTTDETQEIEPKVKEVSATPEAKVKTFKIKNGDQDIDLRADTKFSVKVSGKEEQVSLQDLTSEYSGKTDWSRKYSQLDNERKTFHAERHELQSGIDQLYDLCVKQNKPLDAIQMLTEMLGGDGVKQVMQLRQNMLTQFEEYSNLTPEQREIRDAKERGDLLEAKFKRREEAEQRKTKESKLAEEISGVKTKYKMDDSRYDEIKNTLLKSGQIPAEELTPDLIGNVHVRWEQMDAVDEMAVDMGLDEKAKKSLLIEWGKDATLTKSQVQEIARQVFGKSKQKSTMQKKIEKSGGVNTDTAVSKRKTEEPTFFDDLD